MTDPNTKAAMEGITDDDLAGLTDEERAGLTEDVDEKAVDTEAKAIDDAIASIQKEEEKKPEEPPAVEPPAPEPTEDKPAAEQPPQRPAPLIRDELPPDAAEKLAAIKDSKAVLAKRLDEGDITTGEYVTQLDVLNEQMKTLEFAMFQSKLSRDVARQQAEAAWFADVRGFMADHPEIHASKLLFQSFDLVVREVTEDKNNHGLSNVKQLEMAHKIWTEQLGIKPTANDNAGKAAAPPAAKPKPPAPPTLGALPASNMEQVDDGRYAALDRLMDTDPLAFEKALERLSERELEDYNASR